MIHHIIQYLWLAILTVMLVSGIANGGADALLAKWLRRRWRKQLRPDPAADAVQPPLDARLHEARANSGGKHRSVALAWHVDGEGDNRVVWHNGRTGGSSSVIAFAPARGIGVVVLSNAASSVDALGLRILHHAHWLAGRNDPGTGLPDRVQTIPEPG